MDQNQSNNPGNIPNASASFGTVPNNAEGFRSVPHGSEPFGKVPQPSEAFRMVRNDSESFRTVPQPSERKENHALTVREAARLFEAAGVARTERSIINWCQPNALGVARLDAYFDPNERKYYLTQESVERAIAEEKAKAAKVNTPSEPLGSVPNAVERPAERRPPASEAETVRVEKLEQEVMDLKITNRAKDMFIGQFQKERESFDQERQNYVKELISANRKVGELETKLLQLDRPKGDR